MNEAEKPVGLELPERMMPDTNPVALRHAMLRRANLFLGVTHHAHFLAIPSLAPHYADILASHFAAIGRDFSEPEIALLTQHLATEMLRAHALSPHGKIRVSFETEAPPGRGVRYEIVALPCSLEDQYRSWVETRPPPLFGAQADRIVLELASALVPAGSAPVLDVGAGTGRNSLALARLGHPVDALEVSEALTAVMLEDMEREGLDLRVLRADVLAADTKLPAGRYALTVVSQVVSHFRSVADLRLLLERLAASSATGGRVVLNVFLATRGYEPSAMAVEVSQTMWSSLFTYPQLHAALEGLPFALVADELVYDYERARFPEGQWPPTGWYEPWILGLDIFALNSRSSPVEFHWLVLERRAG